MKLKAFLFSRWFVDADETGLEQKINWSWFIMDILKWFIVGVAAVTILGAGLLMWLNHKQP